MLAHPWKDVHGHVVVPILAKILYLDASVYCCPWDSVRKLKGGRDESEDEAFALLLG